VIGAYIADRAYIGKYRNEKRKRINDVVK